MIRRPPISPLFPYTPLSRSGDGSLRVVIGVPIIRRDAGGAAAAPPLRWTRLPVHHVVAAQEFAGGHMGAFALLRSEEHTSELQSQSNLVCRLLLEKKKKNK